MPFTHLHVHSHYSFLTAVGKIDDLLDRAKELGMTSLALTDYTGLYGAVEFYMHAKEKGIKPIIGAEVYVAKNHLDKNNTSENRRRHTLVLLCENETGYQNLMKLISVAHLEGFYYKARVDRELLRKYHEGLVALSGSLTGEVPSEMVYGNYDRAKAAALEYEEIFGKGNFFLEIQPHPDYENQDTANQGLIALSKETGIPLVATVDVHYVRPEDKATQDILLCIRDNKKVNDTDRASYTHLDLSLRSPESMMEALKNFPEAIENTQKITERCNLEIPLGQTQLPHFEVPETETPESYLRKLCEVGLVKRYGDAVEPKHRERMEYELSVIEKTGFASYFLIVQDFVNWAKDNGVVVGPGRGSAAGSFVAYLTGITNIDPLEYKLLFERFLNPERISMPDVDMDFADTRRDDVLAYVRKKYGEDHVAQIITFGTMAAKAAVRDVGRALGYPYAFCDQISKMIPMFTSLKKSIAEVPDLKKMYEENMDAKKLIDNAMKLEGNARHSSMHACGVVITNKPVTEYTPLQNVSGAKQGVVTQYASSTKSSAVEKIGLLKMDFLGLKNLTIMQNAFRIIRALKKLPSLAEKLGLDPETASVSDFLDKLPLDDEPTFKLFQDARTTGIFQLESNGMKRYLKQLKPTVLEDIIAMVALYRPGPMEWIPDFVDGKHGRKEVKYLHPSLEPILRDTYGVAVYQEQVMQIARDLAGFTMGEADVLRKAMGKKIIDLIQEQRIKFVNDAHEKKQVPKAIAEKVFSFIEPFAGYGFNRSHAACYALIGYQTAFLKAHYPAEFMAALLTSDQHDTDRIAIEVRECREMGVPVLPPDVNESFEEFAVIVGEDHVERIRFGLNAIKNVGETVVAEIVAERKRNGKFQDLTDFVERVRHKDLNKKSLEALAKVGALDQFGERNQLLASVDDILKYSKNLEKVRDSHAESLFGDLPVVASTLRLASAAPASKRERLGWEKELLGLYVSDHPANDYKDYLEKNAKPIADIEKAEENSVVNIGGVVASARKVITKQGGSMFFVSLEDLSGRVELVVFPRTAEQTEQFWKEDEMLFVGAKISHKDGLLRASVETVKKLSPEELILFRRIEATKAKNGEEKNIPNPTETPRKQNNGIIVLVRNDAPAHFLDALSQTLRSCPTGSEKVFVSLYGQKIETSFSITSDNAILDSLRGVEGVEGVRAV